MKRIYFIPTLLLMVITLFSCSSDDSTTPEEEQQADPNTIVTIPDENFKEALINYDNPVIDTNNDGEIQVSEAEAIFELWVINKGIRNLKGIEAFKNIDKLYASSNGNLDTMDLTENTELEVLDVSFTELASINLIENYKLRELDCFSCNFLVTLIYPTNGGVLEDINLSNTILTSINASALPGLKYVACRNTKIIELDFSDNSLFIQLFADNNPLLQNVNVKTGNINAIIDLQVFNSPNLTSICVDDVAYANAQDPDRWKKDSNVIYTTNCN
jgi:PBP1b-binding outer membrane lipoprotein LpoB